MAGRHERDPLSVMFDAGARRLLDRAYARQGQWITTRLANPTPAQLEFARSVGINPYGPDNKSGRGNLNARTAWARAFVRAVYHQHRFWSGDPDTGGWRTTRRTQPRTDLSVMFEIGRALPGGRQAGTVLVPGRQVAIRVMRGGKSHIRREGGQVYTEGEGRSDPRERDW